MASVKLTKNEQKKQKDLLKQFVRYLPTLQLKKQQLQMVIRQIEAQAEAIYLKQVELEKGMKSWVAVFGENHALPIESRLETVVVIEQIIRTRGNIAGVSIPVFENIRFTEVEWDLARTPLWVDYAVEMMKEIALLQAQFTTLKNQIELLEHELRITSQRVNLFEKVKIPQTKENIRRIGIYLGDQQTAAVVRGKISKKKLVKTASGGAA
ncbi:MAG: V-type ATP synthase subunit D [Sphaerochaetaceae bacterium]